LGVAVVGLCAAIYGAIGYVDEQSAASVERKPALRAARATVAARLAPDRARDALPPSASASSNGAGAGAPPLAAPDGDRSAPLIVALGPVDSRLPDARLSDAQLADARLVDSPLAEARLPDSRLADAPNMNAAALPLADFAARADASVARVWARITARDAEQQLARLAADYAELATERDQLRERVKELEQTLASLQLPAGAPQAARMPADAAVGAGLARPGAAVIAFPGAASAGASGEQSRPALKNFTTPGSAPNYFTDESGAVLGNRAAAPAHR
jgi:hypothetical protein